MAHSLCTLRFVEEAPMVPSPWLPSWLGLTWVAIFAVILIAHLWHIVIMTGRDRLWHSVHVLMALGMIVMFAPTGRMIVPSSVGMAVFAASAVAVACLLLWDYAHRHNLGQLWAASVVDLATMVYMFAMMSTRVLWLTILLAVWLVLQAAGWVTGRLWAVLEAGGLGGTRPVQTRVLAATKITAGPAARQPNQDLAAHSTPAPHPPAHNHSHGARVVICTTLALMSLGMVYMLIAMQFGMPPMPGMPMATS
jgi:hypothetical protein